MELMFKLEEGEQLTNFAIADVIYHNCKEPAYAGDLDPEAIARMILEQGHSDEKRKREEMRRV